MTVAPFAKELMRFLACVGSLGAGSWMLTLAAQPPEASSLRVRYSLVTQKQFGIEVKDDKDRWQRLTYSALGTTNVTLLKVGKDTVVFGHNEGPASAAKWQKEDSPTFEAKAQRASGAVAVWLWNQLEVTQSLELVRGAGSQAIDVCKVTYELENKGTQPLDVGVRVLLDTLVGNNDAPAFQALPEGSLILDQVDFASTDKVPAALKVLEVANPKSNGLVAHLSLNLGKPFESPDRLLVTHLPDKGDQWHVKLEPMRDDACVVMYWNERPLEPGAKNRRLLGYAYGRSPYRAP